MIHKKENWIWLGHACHFCCGNQCRFHLATIVGPYLISTVGEYFHTEKERPEEIGIGRLYETMVFLKGRKLKCGCYECNGDNIDFDGYNTAGDATKGHLKMCRKFARKERVK